MSDIPPPEAEVHENDVLKRRKHFSWRAFGGDGFLVSVAFHVLLLLLGLFYVIQKYTEPKKPDTEVFATGAGGGANGDKAKMFEHKMQRKLPTPVKSPSRIVSKSANAAVSLPSSPTASAASFASGLSAGGMSKGSGGGSGGGIGTGQGIGIGGNRNFVSAFGGTTLNNRLVGYIYDFMQTKEGKPSVYKSRVAASNCPWFDPVVSKFIKDGWPQSTLDKYYRGPAQLGVHQIFVPISKDSAAPEAFEAAGKMVGGAWVVVYRGKVCAPESGTIRFCGTADNYIAVRFDRSNVLYYASGRAEDSVIPMSPTVNMGLRMAVGQGKWLNVNKGQWYDIEVLIGDAGGVFSGCLYYERKDNPGKKFLFHTENIPWDEVIAKDTGYYSTHDLPRDIQPESPVWLCKPPAGVIIR